MGDLFNFAAQQFGALPAASAAAATGQNVGQAVINSGISTAGGATGGGSNWALALQAASTLIGAFGAIQQGQAQRAAGEAQARSFQYQARLRDAQAAGMEQSAGQERAAAQRAAIEQRRQGRFVGSRAQAIAAASGGGALDPSIVNLMGDLGSEADFRAATALYQGEDRARSLEYGAVLQRATGQGDLYAGEVARRSGIAAQNRSYITAAGTVAGGVGKMYDRYPPSNTLASGGGGRGLERYMEDVPFASYGGTRYGFYG